MQSAVSTAVHSKRGLSLVQKLQREIRTNKAPYLFVAPYALLFFLFTVLPVMIAIGLSFTTTTCCSLRSGSATRTT